MLEDSWERRLDIVGKTGRHVVTTIKGCLLQDHDSWARFPQSVTLKPKCAYTQIVTLWITKKYVVALRVLQTRLTMMYIYTIYMAYHI